MMIDNDYPVIALVRCLHGADLSAGRVVAVVAHQQHRLLIVVFGFLGTDVDFPDPVNVPAFVTVKRHVVLGAAGV
jgi:hypothetical protein